MKTTIKIGLNQLPDTFETPLGVGSLWKGIPFRSLVKLVLHVIRMCGRRDERRSIYTNGEGLSGIVELRPLQDDKRNHWIGLTASNKKRRTPLTLYCGVKGAEWSICLTSFIIGGRHGELSNGDSTEQRIQSAVIGACGWLHSCCNPAIKALEDDFITCAQADSLLCEAARRRVIPWSAVGNVESLLPGPDGPCLTKSVLLCAVSQVLKSGPPMLFLDRLNRMRRIVQHYQQQ